MNFSAGKKMSRLQRGERLVLSTKNRYLKLMILVFFPCMGRCKNLGSLKSVLKCAS